MKNLPLLLGTLLGTIAIVVALALMFSRPEPVVTVDSAVLMKENRASKGPENAKVTIVEFSDFQCPTCKAFDSVVKSILEKHPNDVRVIYRHFPLTTIHPNAQAAAQAAEVAKTFGKFWEMHDMLFLEQTVWADLDGAAFQKKLEEYAEKLTIDKSEFQKRMDSNEVKEVVTVDVSDGTRANVNGTPTFFVNGQLVPAPQQLPSVVESALAK
jgi:protein-disulfide isomerase